MALRSRAATPKVTGSFTGIRGALRGARPLVAAAATLAQHIQSLVMPRLPPMTTPEKPSIDTVAVEVRVRERERQRKRGRAQMRATASGLPLDSIPLKAHRGQLSVLEEKCPGQSTRRDYARRLSAFSEFCAEHALSTESLDLLDAALVDYSDVLYLKGEQVDSGSKLMAAVVHSLPRLGKNGDSRLPRFLRVLRSWKRVAPTPTRDPISWLVTCGIVGALVRMEEQSMALFVLVLFDTYMRLMEGYELTVKDLVAPAPKVSKRFRFWGLRLKADEEGLPRKGGSFDDLILLDSKGLESLGPRLKALCRGRGEDDKLFSFDLMKFKNTWLLCQKQLGLEGHTFCVHQLRHGGASHDAWEKRRELLDIQRRGGWKTMDTLFRYEKRGRIQKSLSMLSDDTLSWCERSRTHLASLIQGDSSALGDLPQPAAKRRRRR